MSENVSCNVTDLIVQQSGNLCLVNGVSLKQGQTIMENPPLETEGEF